jgi:hypothetical protein
MNNDKIVCQVILCIGNIASENNTYKNMILREDILVTVIKISKSGDKPLTLIRNSLFLITNLCRGEFPNSNIVIYNNIDYSSFIYYNCIFMVR